MCSSSYPGFLLQVALWRRTRPMASTKAAAREAPAGGERSALTFFVILLNIIILFREVCQKIELLDFRLSEKGRGDVVSWDFHPGS